MFTKDRHVHYTYRGTPCLPRADRSTILTGALHVYQGQIGPLFHHQAGKSKDLTEYSFHSFLNSDKRTSSKW